MGATTVAMNRMLDVLNVVYLGAHTGSPGDDGSANAVGGVRPAVTMGAVASDGGTGRQRVNEELVVIGNPGVGLYQAWSLWDAPSGGVCLWVVPFDVVRELFAGDDLRAPVGAVVASVARESA